MPVLASLYPSLRIQQSSNLALPNRPYAECVAEGHLLESP